ncbi:MAG: carboxypeptidase-like regulatory domain-containing protein, partial [Planctomycetota bacterium]
MKLPGRLQLLLAGLGLLGLLSLWPAEGGLPPSTIPLRALSDGPPHPSSLSTPARSERGEEDSSGFSGEVSSGFRVSGSVSDETGSLLEGTRVTLSSPGAEPRETWTDEEGRFAFEPLPGAAWQLLCRLSGYRDLRRPLSPADPSAQSQGLDLRLVLQAAPHLRVKILTSGGTPLMAELHDVFPTDPFRVMASLHPPRRILPPSVFEDPTRLGSGFWMPPWGRRREFQKFASGYEGILFLEHPLPVHVSLLLYQHVLASQRVAPGTEEVVFTVDPPTVRALLGSVRLHLVDGGTGEPPPQASIRLSSVDRLLGSFLSESGG